jgi:integrase
MQPQKFTDLSIQSTESPTQGRVTLWDSSSPLGLRITSKGAKTFVVILGRRRHTIGRYGHITLSQARTAAKQLKAEHTLGRLIPSSRGVAEAVQEYLAAITIRPNTRDYYERNLKRLPDMRLNLVDAPDLNRILDRLLPAARTTALKVYVAFFNWCIRRHYLDTSPCKRFRADKVVSRDRVLTDSEIQSIWLACSGTGSFDSIIKLLFLTAQRKNEIASICTSWIHENKIVFPKEITKNGREHSIGLSATAISILQSAMATSRSLLFPATNTSKSFNNWSYAKLTLDRAVGFDDFTIHDIRRTVASRLIAPPVSARVEVVERILNHRSGVFAGVAGIYIRDQLWDEQLDALQKWDAHLRQIASRA